MASETFKYSWEDRITYTSAQYGSVRFSTVLYSRGTVCEPSTALLVRYLFPALTIRIYIGVLHSPSLNLQLYSYLHNNRVRDGVYVCVM